MQFQTDDYFIYLKTPYTMKDKIVADLNGTYTKKGFRFPKNVHSLRELYRYFPELRNNWTFVELGRTLADDLQERKNIKINNNHVKGLRPYQAQDSYFLQKTGSSLVLNEPRTGKTPTMIKTLDALRPDSTLIVTPSSLTYNWKKEIGKWSDLYNEHDAYVYAGTPKQREVILNKYLANNNGYKILIVSKDTLKRDKELQDRVFSVMIVDEAHFLRNYKTAQSKAIFNITASTRFALTGTPAVKHGVDVYGMLHFINPKAFPSYWQFAARYWHIDDDGWGKAIGNPRSDREAELLDVMDTVSVQRKRKDVMTWLPDAQHQTLYVQMDTKQQKLYDQMLETFQADDDEHEVDTMNQLTQLIRLRQLCLEPRLLGFDKVVGAKTTALLEFAEDNPEPFIVMTTFSSYFKLIKPELEKLGKKVGIIDGSIGQKEKFATAERFQKGEYDILLCNIIAAGTGFTLDRADTIVFLDKDFSPSNNEQAQDRIVPTTKERQHSINIISLVVADSIDERVNDILDQKEDLTKLINKRELFV